MPAKWKNFFSADDGAVTVDWVVLTAAIVGLALGVILNVQNAVVGQSDDVSNFVSSQTNLLPSG